MGYACDYVCEKCAYVAKSAGVGFDHGKASKVIAYVLCLTTASSGRIHG